MPLSRTAPRSLPASSSVIAGPRGWPRSSMAPYLRIVTFAPVRPRGRVWIAMTARYRLPRVSAEPAAQGWWPAGQREETVQAGRVGEVTEPGGGGEGEHQRQAEGQAARGGRAVGRRPGDQRRRYAQPGGDQQHDRGEVSRRAQRGEQVPRQWALSRGADAGQAERVRQRVLDQRGRGGHGGGGQARGQDGGGADRRGREPGGTAGAVPGGDHGRQHRHGGPGGVLHRARHADRDGGGPRARGPPGAGGGRGTGGGPPRGGGGRAAG